MISALVRPFQLALFTGKADPAPLDTRRVRFTPPQWLPVGTIDLVRLADVVLALTLYSFTVSELDNWNDPTDHPLPVIYYHVTALCFSLPVALRDRWPLASWRTAILLMPVAVYTIRALDGFPVQGITYTIPMIIMYMLVLYNVAIRCEQAVSIALWVISTAFLWVINWSATPLGAVIFAVPLVLGYNVRARRSTSAKLAEESQRKVVAQGAQTVLEERTRIARELHDVVAHHMSVIAIQAEAVPLKAAGDPRQLEEGLAEIRTLSLDAIAQLRQVLGVLRDDEGRKETTPQPGLDRVAELVANARAAGLAVLFRQSGKLEEVPQAVGLSAYRIVQESLSNVMRHAPGATVSLELAMAWEELTVRVANGPATRPVGETSGAGHGLVGMRERVALLGGTLEAGPIDDGFEVVARLPWEDD